MTWKTTKTNNKSFGADLLLKHLKTTDKSLDSVILTTAFGATVERSARENGRIAIFQKQQGRWPWFIDSKEMSVFKKKIRIAFSRAIKGNMGHGLLVNVSESIGQLIINVYKKHLLEKRNKKGNFTPLINQTAIKKN